MILLIGDVQGCDGALQRLLDEAGFTPSRDRLVLLGDLVNRGPDSLAVLRRLRSLGEAATCLLGNHDLHLLAMAHGIRPAHGSDTCGDVLRAPDREAWVDWLRQRPLAHVEAGWLCVHAGVLPEWTAEDTLRAAAEVQAELRGPALPAFLQRMYGNEPRRWRADLPRDDRQRLIVNALTRLRFVDAEGAMDFKTKEGAAGAPPGHRPWFEAPGRRTAGTPIAFGHWSTLGLVNRPELLGLDTGCVWGGALSAARVDGGRREVLQVACTAALRPGT